MENTKQQKQAKADQFWQTHFAEYMDTAIDEVDSLQSDFLDKLRTTFESVDIETIEDVIVSKIAIRIMTADMHLKVIKVAKQVWDRKQRELAQ